MSSENGNRMDPDSAGYWVGLLPSLEAIVKGSEIATGKAAIDARSHEAHPIGERDSYWLRRRKVWLQYAFDRDPDRHEDYVTHMTEDGEGAPWARGSVQLSDLASCMPEEFLSTLRTMPFSEATLDIAANTIWMSAEAVAANALHHILGRWPRVFEVRRMCEMAQEQQAEEAPQPAVLHKIWLASLLVPNP